MVRIEIDGKEIKANDGDMLIEAADAAGVYIPRFCYHKKLSVAANCRMCLVEVEKARKPLPACATPVTDGMKVFTQSPSALAAQKGVMEFLLINHPLDCPICDQGGECELQDVAMGYGRDVSRYCERKRVVPDKNLGPLISTDMTRCIHCTRCVRFGQEVAGLKELGATGRGEHMQIGTYVEKTVDSEMSGNVIDLCPVGALTSKPFRFSARAWEMAERHSIAPHDGVGSNIAVHLKGREIKRVVPKENETINETWISDRDRFSYQGLNSNDHLTRPMIKEGGQWKTVDWETAINAAVNGLQKVLNVNGAEKTGFLSAPNQSMEELYLLQKLARSVGSENVDHRLRQNDMSDQASMPNYPGLGMSLAAVDKLQNVLIVGSNIRKEQPILAHRLRKASLWGANISCINSMDYSFHFDVKNNIVVAPQKMLGELAAIAKAANCDSSAFAGISGLIDQASVNDAHQAMLASLKAGKAAIILGNVANSHEQAADLRRLALAISTATGASLCFASETANSAGAWLAGALPHRGTGGAAVKGGLNTVEMLQTDMAAYVLLGLDPELDFIDGQLAMNAFGNAEFVLAITPYFSESLSSVANVILPVASFAETPGSYVNMAGDWQKFEALVPVNGEARPAWKVLRVLGSLLAPQGFDYLTIDDVHQELKQQVTSLDRGELKWSAPGTGDKPHNGFSRISDVPMYSIDNIVRRAHALQHTADAVPSAVYVNAATAAKAGLQAGDMADVQQKTGEVLLPVIIDEKVPDDCVYVPACQVQTVALGASYGEVSLRKAGKQSSSAATGSSNA